VSVCMHVCMYVYVHTVQLLIQSHTHTHTHTHAHTHTTSGHQRSLRITFRQKHVPCSQLHRRRPRHTPIYMYTYIHTYMNIHTHIMYVHIHIHTHTHTHKTSGHQRSLRITLRQNHVPRSQLHSRGPRPPTTPTC
jgi:hypothetical protein